MYDFDTDSLIIQVKDSPAFAGDVKIKFISANKVSSSPEEKVTFKNFPYLQILKYFVLLCMENSLAEESITC